MTGGGGNVAAAPATTRERKPIWGSAGLYCPQWGPGAKPLVRGLEDEVSPEAEAFSQLYLPALLVLCESKMHGERQTQPMV
jgi:hypothetical protein